MVLKKNIHEKNVDKVYKINDNDEKDIEKEIVDYNNVLNIEKFVNKELNMEEFDNKNILNRLNLVLIKLSEILYDDKIPTKMRNYLESLTVKDLLNEEITLQSKSKTKIITKKEDSIDDIVNKYKKYNL